MLKVLEIILLCSVGLLSRVVNASLTEARHGAYRLSGSRPVCEARTDHVANTAIALQLHRK